jgi:type IV pilus assembly protein PilM
MQEVLSVAQLSPSSEERANVQRFKEVLYKWISESTQSQSADLVVSLSSAKTFIHFSETQSVQTATSEYISWEMEQYLGTDFKKGLYHWAIHPTQPDNTPLLFVACRQEEIEYLKTLFDFPNLKLAVVDIDVFAMANAFELNYSEHANQSQLLLSVEKHGLNLTYRHQGCLQYCKYIPNKGTTEELEENAFLKNYIQEVSHHFENPLYKENKTSVFLSGEFASSSLVLTELQKLSAWPVEVLDPFCQISLSNSTSISSIKDTVHPEFTVALGLALREERQEGDHS